MARERFYNQAQVAATVYGQAVEQLGEGDSIRFIPEATGATKTTGLDNTTLSFSSDTSGAVEIDLQPTSPTLALLYEKWNDQKTGNAALTTITIKTGVNEFDEAEDCAIENIGQKNTGGPTGQLRTVRFLVARFNFDLAR